MTGSFTDEDVGRAFKVGEADSFFFLSILLLRGLWMDEWMDGWMVEGGLWWWSKILCEVFFESFVVKRVCFFADDMFDSF